MSMILNLRGIGNDEIDELLADPESITALLYPERSMPQPKPGLLARLFGVRVMTAPIPEPVVPPGGAPLECDLDKTWHGIHFLLTGDPWEGDAPLNFLLQGGTEVGDVDVGYGPARAMRPAEVKAAAEALAGISSEELRKRFDPAKMMAEDIYPTIWNRDPAEDDTLGYLVEYFEQLKKFMPQIVEKNLGLLVYLY